MAQIWAMANENGDVAQDVPVGFPEEGCHVLAVREDLAVDRLHQRSAVRQRATLRQRHRDAHGRPSSMAAGCTRLLDFNHSSAASRVIRTLRPTRKVAGASLRFWSL